MTSGGRDFAIGCADTAQRLQDQNGSDRKEIEMKNEWLQMILNIMPGVCPTAFNLRESEIYSLIFTYIMSLWECLEIRRSGVNVNTNLEQQWREYPKFAARIMGSKNQNYLREVDQFVTDFFLLCLFTVSNLVGVQHQTKQYNGRLATATYCSSSHTISKSIRTEFQVKPNLFLSVFRISFLV